MSKNVSKLRGTALFDEFEALLPHFNNLNEDDEFKFSKAIFLMARRFRIEEYRRDNIKWPTLREDIEHMRQLYVRYLTKDVIIASAIFLVMANVESRYLGDYDGRLMYKLTKAYIDRAKSAQGSSSKMAPSLDEHGGGDKLHP